METIDFWFPCLLAWVFKATILRYGGMRVYQKARPFFLGMVLGEFGMAVFFVVFNLLSAWLTPQHNFPLPPYPGDDELHSPPACHNRPPAGVKGNRCGAANAPKPKKGRHENMAEDTRARIVRYLRTRTRSR